MSDHTKQREFGFHPYFYFIYLYLYPPDWQESDGSANTYGKQLP